MPYILSDARASYVHWWKRQIDTYALWMAYRHLNIPELHYVPRIPRRRYVWGRGADRWIRPWDISTSGESRFVQNGYAKKEADSVKSDWRQRKGFALDQAKKEDRRGCPSWLKRQCNKDYRRWQKDLIQKGQFEKLGSKTRKDFFDPWMWD